jgi:hypothetical protein
VRYDGPRHQEDRLHVHRQYALPHVLGRVVDGVHVENASVVDQHVEPTEARTTAATVADTVSASLTSATTCIRSSESATEAGSTSNVATWKPAALSASAAAAPIPARRP